MTRKEPLTYPWPTTLKNQLLDFSTQNPIIHNTRQIHTPALYTTKKTICQTYREGLPTHFRASQVLPIFHRHFKLICMRHWQNHASRNHLHHLLSLHQLLEGHQITHRLFLRLLSYLPQRSYPIQIFPNAPLAAFICFIPQQNQSTLQEWRLLSLNQQSKSHHQSWRPTTSNQCTVTRQQQDNRRSNFLHPRIRNRIRFYKCKIWCCHTY